MNGVTRHAYGALLLLVTASFGADGARGQAPDVEIGVGGLIQAESSVGWITRAPDEHARAGFGLRRARLRVTADIGPRAGAFIHFQGDGGTFGVLDAFAFYDAAPTVRVRLGRMASAQPRSFIRTPVNMMDATERAAIALRWNGATHGTAGRDFGLDISYQSDRAEVVLFLHNGDGRFDRLTGNFQQNIVGDVTGGADRSLSDLAVSVYGAYRPGIVAGLEIGGYAGYSGGKNESTAVNGVGRDYVSYSGHVYWGAYPGSQPVRLKADVIGIRFEEVPTRPLQDAMGASLFGAIALRRSTEVFGRFELFDSDLDVDPNRDAYVTTGVTFSPSALRGRPFAQERLTVSYSIRTPEDGDAPLNQLVTAQFQVVF